MTHGAWIILTGALVGASCGIVGCFLVLRRMAMLGDAISHSILLGIVGAFLISHSREGIPMLIGALVVGLLTTLLVQLFHQSGVQSDASIGVVFTALFAVGVILVSVFTRQIDLDLECVLYGEIAYVPWNTLTVNGKGLGPLDVWQLGGVFLFNLLIIALFYKELKVSSFDAQLAAAMGIPVLIMHYLLMGMVSMTTVASFESVGAILVVAMLIVPGATAYLLTDRLSHMLLLSGLFGVLSSVFGYVFASLINASISGAMTTVAGAMFLLAFIFSPRHGLWARWKKSGESAEPRERKAHA